MSKKTSAKSPAQPAQAAASAPQVEQPAKAKKNLSLSERLELIRPHFPAPPDFHEVLQEIAKAVEGK